MPNLTTAENGLLKSLGSTAVMGKGRLKEVAALIHRLMFLADESAQDKRIAEARYHFVAGAVHGLLSKKDILAKGLPEPLQEEALLLRQQHDDAQAWRQQEADEDRLSELDKDDHIAMELREAYHRETADDETDR